MSDGSIARFGQGVMAVPRAIGLIARTPRLRALALWPTVISVLLLGGGVYLAFRYGREVADALLPERLEPILGAARAVIDWVVRIVLAAVALVVLLFGSQILAEPFLDPLSEHTEVALGAAAEAPRRGVLKLAGSLARVLCDIAIDLTLYLVAIALAFLLHLLPVIGVFVGPLASWFVSALFAGTNQVSSPLARRGYYGLGRWRAAQGDRARVLGLGTAVFALLLIPLAQVVALPVAVVAGTIAVLDAERAGRVTRAA